MKCQGVGRETKSIGNPAGRQSLRAGFDQQPEDLKPEPAKQPMATSPANPPAKKQPARATAVNKTEPEPKKEDSKVGSILKKTGRILKKPFKF